MDGGVDIRVRIARRTVKALKDFEGGQHNSTRAGSRGGVDPLTAIIV